MAQPGALTKTVWVRNKTAKNQDTGQVVFGPGEKKEVPEALAETYAKLRREFDAVSRT